jgi:hypothetical protein
MVCFTAAGLAAQAQSPTKPAPAIDSTKVYTYVERMPIYPGSSGMKGLTTDLLREFQAVGAKNGCSPPAPVFVKFIVGPSGVIYNVASVNNSEKTPHPRLSETCENALIEAARKLPRFKPGMQNGRRVAVSYTLKLVSAQ